MTGIHGNERAGSHDHVFLGPDHEKAERRTWAVIALCTVMMVAEIVGGAMFGSLALIADGLHMSTHAGALLLAALAYTYARKYAGDRNFTFGTGKFGDLAGYSSAIVLAMIALLIGYEAVSRFLNPVAISFEEAIPIAVLGLAVNVVVCWGCRRRPFPLSGFKPFALLRDSGACCWVIAACRSRSPGSDEPILISACCFR